MDLLSEPVITRRCLDEGDSTSQCMEAKSAFEPIRSQAIALTDATCLSYTAAFSGIEPNAVSAGTDIAA